MDDRSFSAAELGKSLLVELELQPKIALLGQPPAERCRHPVGHPAIGSVAAHPKPELAQDVTDRQGKLLFSRPLWVVENPNIEVPGFLAQDGGEGVDPDVYHPRAPTETALESSRDPSPVLLVDSPEARLQIGREMPGELAEKPTPLG
jgi:hypothetical protein